MRDKCWGTDDMSRGLYIALLGFSILRQLTSGKRGDRLMRILMLWPSRDRSGSSKMDLQSTGCVRLLPTHGHKAVLISTHARTQHLRCARILTSLICVRECKVYVGVRMEGALVAVEGHHSRHLRPQLGHLLGPPAGTMWQEFIPLRISVSRLYARRCGG